MVENQEIVMGAMGTDLAVQVLDQLPTPVFAVNTNMEVIFMNKAGQSLLGMNIADILGKTCASLFKSKHCDTTECRMKHAMESGKACTARNELTINSRTVPIEYTAAPLRDENGKIIGGLEYAIDITERVRDENRLREQSRTIQEISTPAISLWEGIVVLPVLGIIDSLRAKQMMNAMLNKIKETSAKTIILDIQGVAAVDTAVANHLIKITKATKLMGCRCIISGISPAVAETLVQLGIDLGDVATNSSLRDALGDAFTLMNLEVKKKK
ncbi:PAS domain-containing protein [Maridesulfovibrio frigidus]|uniref:PAS domain-containing protein n=1 Tax=Maridesulfovibrio frigidus TaxID=340956 RepID=UPI00068EC003|nr:PAS domain-containing protein [Maridesulfovibrio frigidus]